MISNLMEEAMQRNVDDFYENKFIQMRVIDHVKSNMKSNITYLWYEYFIKLRTSANFAKF